MATTIDPSAREPEYLFRTHDRRYVYVSRDGSGSDESLRLFSADDRKVMHHWPVTGVSRHPGGYTYIQTLVGQLFVPPVDSIDAPEWGFERIERLDPSHFTITETATGTTIVPRDVPDDERANDQFRVLKVWSVERSSGRNRWELSFSTGTGMLLTREEFDDDVPEALEPHQGDVVRLYGPGTSIHGVDLNGRRLWYHTEQERHSRDEQGLQKLASQDPELFKLLQSRTSARHQEGGHEEREYPPALIANADRIAAHLRAQHGWQHNEIATIDEAQAAAQRFAELSWDEQNARVPELDGRGGTIADACLLAVVRLIGQPI